MHGDLFTSTADAIGHGVNCKGVMGAGIAKQFRARYPDMYQEYRRICAEGLLLPGEIHTYTSPGVRVINIASQEHPGPNANLYWLTTGVASALLYCKMQGLTTLALPRIGCGIGGLAWDDVYLALDNLTAMTVVRLEVWTL